eukprot:TRINITY_DN30377_c0_g1_i2.p2 TRINITY_DN30377_c0_g1~~TRINITY_DN30377_c0_g1_i2.p2  ORF type:complete len:101 (+),score=13.70 TRINITY_DN30377_c0_g1_i2:411-713(+)
MARLSGFLSTTKSGDHTSASFAWTWQGGRVEVQLTFNSLMYCLAGRVGGGANIGSNIARSLGSAIHTKPAHITPVASPALTFVCVLGGGTACEEAERKFG